ncbi:hypothetical protein [Mycobacterium sp. SMC-4]|uniref:hypothetical protein n=1 Tax=Mycobacterium sp. SMC-4 TaxID=2857059 RepID=UPI003CFD3995
MSEANRDSGEHTEAFTPDFTGAFTAVAGDRPAAVSVERPAAVSAERPAAVPVERPAAVSVERPAAVEIPPHPAQPLAVPGVAQYLSRWRFVLVLLGVWVVAAAAGAGAYYWWFHSVDKTMPVFVVLVYVVAATVGGLLTALVQERPVVAGLAIGLMSAPLASVAAAAVLYGGYAYGWITP